MLGTPLSKPILFSKELSQPFPKTLFHLGGMKFVPKRSPQKTSTEFKKLSSLENYNKVKNQEALT